MLLKIKCVCLKRKFHYFKNYISKYKIELIKLKRINFKNIYFKLQ